jgi:hypothetical protein
MSQTEFLLYANQVLSVALQNGNSDISSIGITDLLRSGYHLGKRNSIKNNKNTNTRNISTMDVTWEENVLYGNTNNKKLGLRERRINFHPVKVTIDSNNINNNNNSLYLYDEIDGFSTDNIMHQKEKEYLLDRDALSTILSA